jgi:asparagine synthase (glutamine-hydrolysing)
MCGIFGYINTNGIDIDADILRMARDTLIHRGPDSSGEYTDGVSYLGFRRLAILDLSPQGNQPMSNESGTTWIIFNGEIYNFIELRLELESKGHHFRSTSDTEVLIHLYDELGVEMFKYLNGMFAIAIYDQLKGEIILCRDRLGKKPLFFWHHDHTLAFASELRALRSLPGFPSEFDRETIGLYLRLGWVPSWKCIYPGVQKLPPGTYVRFSIKLNQLEDPIQYWALPQVDINTELSENEWLDQIEDLLWDATRIRLRSDVPLGVFLSGGIDSGLIAAAAKRQTNGNLISLTINFPDWAENEWVLAEKTANKLGIIATNEILHANGMELMPDIMAHFDEPFSDSSALPTSLVCEAARKTMTVAISGDGGDEIFSGYENHVRAWQWRNLDRIPLSFREALSQYFLPITRPDSRTRRFLKRFQNPVENLGMGDKLYPFEDWINSYIRPEYRLSDADIVKIWKENVIQWKNINPLDQIQRTDIRMYMLNDVLVKVDRMSMRHSLEVRSPFLDYRLVELALTIPPALRVKNGENKYLLRRLAERYLPDEVVHAPKRGFGIPLYNWLIQGKQQSPVKNTTLISNSENGYLVDPLGLENLWKNSHQNPNLIYPLFRMLSFDWWLQGLR